MSSDEVRLLLQEATQIRKLLELLAEPAIAQRDARFRDELRRIVGSSVPKQKAVLLMDGSRTQTQLAQESGAHKGHLSTMVGQLEGAGLLGGDKKLPRLVITIPTTFFDGE
jgi:hypothetical protein